MLLPREFYARKTITVARDLLGRVLVHNDGEMRRAGVIVETEAYIGPHDLACHASKGRTQRTDVMFGPPGHAYIYLIYGMYDCFNVVTERVGYAAAVLVRAVAPLSGCEGKTDGPGKLCRAMHITRALNRFDLTNSALVIEEGTPVSSRRVSRGPRIGVDYAGDWAHEQLRFWVTDDPHVSHRRASERHAAGRATAGGRPSSRSKKSNANSR